MVKTRLTYKVYGEDMSNIQSMERKNRSFDDITNSSHLFNNTSYLYREMEEAEL